MQPRSRYRARARGRRSTTAARAGPSRPCRAGESRWPDAAGRGVAAREADVSPVEAHATARIATPWRIICRTRETRTVIPRSLNEPVWDYRRASPTDRSRRVPVRTAPPRRGWFLPRPWTRCCPRRRRGRPLLLAPTEDPYGQVRALVALVEQPHPGARRTVRRASRSCDTSSRSPHLGSDSRIEKGIRARAALNAAPARPGTARSSSSSWPEEETTGGTAWTRTHDLRVANAALQLS